MKRENPDDYQSDYVKRHDAQGHLKVMECLRKWDPLAMIENLQLMAPRYYDFSVEIVRLLDAGASKNDLMEHFKKICTVELEKRFRPAETEKIIDELLLFWRSWKKGSSPNH